MHTTQITCRAFPLQDTDPSSLMFSITILGSVKESLQYEISKSKHVLPVQVACWSAEEVVYSLLQVYELAVPASVVNQINE